MKEDLSKGLDRFFDNFSPTIQLADELIRSRSHAQEVLILLCSRIDALASGAAPDDESSGRSFTSFLAAYSGRSGQFESVSTGDLYYELDYHLWLMPGMLEKPGRIRIFSRLNEPILKLLPSHSPALSLPSNRIAKQ